MNHVPFVDLKPQHEEIAEEVSRAFASIFARTAFVLGEEVKTFEVQLARYLNVARCVAVANGTDAIELALRALGIGPGDEVIVPANTFVATPLAVMRAGATVVIADCDARYQLLDPEEVAKKISAKTKAIIPVHLFGQMAPMAPILELARARGLSVIEDAAQSQGSKQHGIAMGGFGAAAATSFYPGKNLGAYGDGGAVVSNDEAIAQKIAALRNYGSEVKYHHPEVGFNSRLDTLQAAVLIAKLARLDTWNSQRREAAKKYDLMLSRIKGVSLPETLPGNEHNYHLYVVRVEERDRVLAALKEADIGAGIHYPLPIHLQGAMSSLGHKSGDFPNAERAALEILSLPMFPGITVDQQERVAGALARAVGR